MADEKDRGANETAGRWMRAVGEIAEEAKRTRWTAITRQAPIMAHNGANRRLARTRAGPTRPIQKQRTGYARAGGIGQSIGHYLRRGRRRKARRMRADVSPGFTFIAVGSAA